MTALSYPPIQKKKKKKEEKKDSRPLLELN
jgi:hypothetical protein